MLVANQNSFTLQLETGDPLDVREFTLEDGLSSLFSIDVIARSQDPALDYDGAAGTNATFTITPENGGAMRISVPSPSSTSTRCARSRPKHSATSSREAPTRPATSSADGRSPDSAK